MAQEKDINISISEDDNIKKSSWSIPFNGVNSDGLFFYLKNTTSNNIQLDKISIFNTNRASTVQLIYATGDPNFSREEQALIINKELINRSIFPDIEANFCADASGLASLGQLDVIALKEELTLYKIKPKVIISPGTLVVLTGRGTFSGTITISI